MNQEKVGKLIAKKRKEKNLSQQDLAQKLNVSDKSISRWENGITMPDVSLFNDICNILDLTLEELLSGEEKIKGSKETINYIKYQKKRNNKKILLTSIVSIVFIIILILCIFFLNNFNSIKIYHMNGNGNIFSYNDSIFIDSNIKYIYTFGNVTSNDEKITKDNIRTISLKYKEIYVMGGTYHDQNRTIIENNGYQEIFKDYIVNDLDNWYIEITYNDNNEVKSDLIKLNYKKEIVNNSLFYKKVNSMSNENLTYEEELKRQKDAELAKDETTKLLLDNGFRPVEEFDEIKVKNRNEFAKKIENGHFYITPGIDSYHYIDDKYYMNIIAKGRIYHFSNSKTYESFSYDNQIDKLECLKKTCPSNAKEIVKKYVEMFEKDIPDLLYINPNKEFKNINILEKEVDDSNL